MALESVGSNGLVTLSGIDLVKFVPDLRAMQAATDGAIGTAKAAVVDGDAATLSSSKSYADQRDEEYRNVDRALWRQEDAATLTAAKDDATTRFGGLPARVTAVESKNTAQDTAITAARSGAVADAKTYTDNNKFYRGHNLSADLNAATERGVYTYGIVPANAPTTALGDVEVHLVGTTIVQNYQTFEDVPRIFQRRFSSGTWRAWVEYGSKLTQGKGILAAGTDLNTLNQPVHNGDYTLASANWSSYLNLPADTATNRGTLEVISPNSFTVTQRICPSAGTKRYERFLTSTAGPVFTPWQVIDSAATLSSSGTIAALPTADWVHWGDSLTEGVGLNGNGWTVKLAALTGKSHLNKGWSGHYAAQIAARQGGNPALVTVAGGSIPASGGSVLVEAATPHISIPVGTQNTTQQVPGILAGRTGYLIDSGSTTTADAYFFPTDSGGASAAAGVQQFLPTGDADTGRGRVITICVGENDIFSTGQSPQMVAHNARQMRDYQSTSVKRALVMSIPRRQGLGINTSVGQKVQAINDALKAEMPSSFVDVAGYLMSDQAATDAGITYTTDDRDDIADGVTPSSFRLPGDSVHWNATAATIIAAFLFNAARERGWL